MITIITGLPGNGKTLYALAYVKAYAEKEKREVFYSGIKDLLLPWTEIKPEEWVNLPAGSIMVIDEAQFVFPKKPNGSKLPEHYEKLAVHRHNGLDIFVITQHPGLIDNFLRNLAGRHLHVIRKFGMQRANVWEWAAANASPEKASSHKNAILHKWAYPKAAFEYYKSAEVHTVKLAIPAKLILACLFVVGVLVVGYFVLDRFQNRYKATPDISSPGVVSAAPVVGATGVSTTAGAGASFRDPVADSKQFVFNRTERVVGVASTAPRYDTLTEPTVVPVPAACVSSKRQGCKCYTQQGTPMQVPVEMCSQIVEKGYFQDFAPDGIESRSSRVASSDRVLDDRVSADSPRSSVMVFGVDSASYGKPESVL